MEAVAMRTARVMISIQPETRRQAGERVAELGTPYTFSSYLTKLVELDAKYRLLKNGIDPNHEQSK